MDNEEKQLAQDIISKMEAHRTEVGKMLLGASFNSVNILVQRNIVQNINKIAGLFALPLANANLHAEGEARKPVTTFLGKPLVVREAKIVEASDITPKEEQLEALRKRADAVQAQIENEKYSFDTFKKFQEQPDSEQILRGLGRRYGIDNYSGAALNISYYDALIAAEADKKKVAAAKAGATSQKKSEDLKKKKAATKKKAVKKKRATKKKS